MHNTILGLLYIHVNSNTWMYHMDANLKSWREFHKNATSYIEQIQEVTPHRAAAVWPTISHHLNHRNKTNKTYVIQLEKQGRTHN